MTPKNPELSKEDLEKIERLRKRTTGVEVDEFWYFIGEFGYYYGYDGISAILDNKITLDAARTMLQAAIKVRHGIMVEQTSLLYNALIASNSKRGKSIINSALSPYKSSAKVDT